MFARFPTSTPCRACAKFSTSPRAGMFVEVKRLGNIRNQGSGVRGQGSGVNSVLHGSCRTELRQSGKDGVVIVSRVQYAEWEVFWIVAVHIVRFGSGFLTANVAACTGSFCRWLFLTPDS